VTRYGRDQRDAGRTAASFWPGRNPDAIDRLAAAIENQGKKLSDIETDANRPRHVSVASRRQGGVGHADRAVFALAAGIMAAIRYLALIRPPRPAGHP